MVGTCPVSRSPPLCCVSLPTSAMGCTAGERALHEESADADIDEQALVINGLRALVVALDVFQVGLNKQRSRSITGDHDESHIGVAGRRTPRSPACQPPVVVVGS